MPLKQLPCSRLLSAILLTLLLAVPSLFGQSAGTSGLTGTICAVMGRAKVPRTATNSSIECRSLIVVLILFYFRTAAGVA